MLNSSAAAITPLNIESIKQAQLYGTSQAKSDLSNFLKPWLSYEEKAEQLNETAETAYLYTPFLLIATNAREKKLHNQKSSIEDSEQIITDYLDTLSFSVKLFGNKKEFPKNAIGIIKQDEKIIKTWYSAVPDSAEESTWLKNTKFMAQCYFYFNEKELDIKKPVTLVVITADKKERQFYFELDKIK